MFCPSECLLYPLGCSTDFSSDLPILLHLSVCVILLADVAGVDADIPISILFVWAKRRLAAPVLLFYLLDWLVRDDNGEDAPLYEGWCVCCQGRGSGPCCGMAR
eukprot:364276-Chlamydomonas_euryale.AAC.3